MPEHPIDCLQHFYRSSNIKLRIRGGLSDTITAGKGIKQGDLLLIHLFNAVIDLCTSQLDPGIGFNISEDMAYFMAYADEVIIFS